MGNRKTTSSATAAAKRRYTEWRPRRFNGGAPCAAPAERSAIRVPRLGPPPHHRWISMRRSSQTTTTVSTTITMKAMAPV